MRVVIDARRLQDRPLTGAGRWLANLVPLLAAQTPVVLLTDGRRHPVPSPVDQEALWVAPRLPEVFWLQGSAARWLWSHEGLFHGTFNAVPFACRRPVVVTIFDLSFEHHPEDFSAAKRALFSAQARWSARRAAMVITISDHARSAIVEAYGVDPDRVVVAPPSVDPVFLNAPSAHDFLAAHGVKGPYLVAIGGAPRRGLRVAVAAWKRLRADGLDVDLVVGGAEDPGRAPGLIYVGRVGDSDWAGVLKGASALCYPTRFEGYGMPALEAAACGVPVVCGRIGPLPEVLGDAAEWCDPTKPQSVADALARVVSDSGRHRDLRDAGLARAAAAPTWASSAEVVLNAYRRAGL
ncbi:MAG: glycosyltransferase family 4 protein [Acidimicrobiales bacterium]